MPRGVSLSNCRWRKFSSPIYSNFFFLFWPILERLQTTAVKEVYQQNEGSNKSPSLKPLNIIEYHDVPKGFMGALHFFFKMPRDVNLSGQLYA